jgi:phage tail sheath gpL-like
MPIVIQGFSSSFKVPGFFAETKFQAGPISAGSIPLICLLVGLGSSAATMTADTVVYDAPDATTGDTLAGIGSELARMNRAALRTAGVKIKIARPTAGGGAAGGTATITIVGTATTTGTLSYRIGGDGFSVTIASTNNETTVATAIKNAINALATLPVTATSSSGVVTVTHKTGTIRGSQLLIAQDVSATATGISSALAGGTPLTGGIVPFTGGAGTEDVTNLATTLFPGWYQRIGIAQNDSSNLAKWKTQSDSKAGVLEGRMEHYTFATNGTLSAAATLSTSTLNNERFCNMWYLNSETLPSEITAAFAAARTSAEQPSDSGPEPNVGYDGFVLPGIKPQSQPGDWPSITTQQTALDEGVTPIATTASGGAVVVRAITTHTLSGSTADYRTLDLAQATVPDFVRYDLSLFWTTEYQPNNPHVRADPTATEKDPAPGIATPRRWNTALQVKLARYEERAILTNTTLNPPVSEFDATAGRIMSIIPTIPMPLNHQVGVSIRQFNLS